MLRPAVVALAALLAVDVSWGCTQASSDGDATADASVGIPAPGGPRAPGAPGGEGIGADDAGARFTRALDGGVGGSTSGLACGPLRCPVDVHATANGPACCIDAFVERLQVASPEDGGGAPASNVTYAYACAPSASECADASVAELACAGAADCPTGERCCASRAAGEGQPLVSRCAATCDAGEAELCDPHLLFSSCANWCDASRARGLGLPDGYGACAVVRP